MFNKHKYANSRPGGVGVLEVIDQEVKHPQFVPLRRTELRGEVTGPLAALTLVHTYGYSSQVCDKVIEAVYRFPLPGDAAVTGVRVRFGDVEIATELKPREQAEEEYDEAKQQGKQAALLTRESFDVFTLRVAGIKPDEDVVVETDYVQLARPQTDQAGWLLRVPLTTAPRYVREDELESRHAQGQPLALDVLVRGIDEAYSPTHRIDLLLDGDEHDRRVRLSDGDVLPDRDFVLTWSPFQQPDRPALNVLLHNDDEHVYFLALVAPPSEHTPGTGVPREIVLLVDHSGSMNGAKWSSADWTVNSFFRSLLPQDYFALGLFHTKTKWFDKQPRQATERNVEAAADYLDRNRDSGGTNLGVALEQALGLKQIKQDPLARHVLVVTDAQVSDSGRLFRLADHEAKAKRRRRISVLCIDAAPNSFLANELAERGGGVAYFLTSNPEEEDITTALEGVLADWAEPVLTGLKLEIDQGGGEAAGREVEAQRRKTVIDLGDLPCGRAIWVAGRLPANGETTLAFSVANDEKTVAYQSVPAAGANRPALKALFGARRLLGLEYLLHARYKPAELKAQLKRLGYDPDVVTKSQGSVYAENELKSAQEALGPLLVEESLKYGIACAETAFVAVRQEAGEKIEGTMAVANALPAGWSDDFLSGAAPGGPPKALMRARGGATLGATQAMADTMSMGMTMAAAPAPEPLGRKLKQMMDGARAETEEEADERPVQRGDVTVFSGTPAFANGEAVLFDSAGDDKLAGHATLTQIAVTFAGAAPDPAALDRNLKLLLYVGDLAMPRATVRLADLLRGGGSRPLNLRKKTGQVVRVVLQDPQGSWAGGAPELVVKLTVG